MGIGGGETGLIIDQLKYYYIFQKKLYSVVNNEQNFTLFNAYSKFSLQEVYIINKSWIKKWKNITHYEIIKDSFGKIIAKDENDLLRQMEIIFYNLLNCHIIPFKINLPFYDNNKEFKIITTKQILELNEFECLVDKKTYELFQETGKTFFWSGGKDNKIEMILSQKILILLIKEKYLAKIIYYGILENNNQLIQLSAKLFDKEGDGKFSENIYNAFINFLLGINENYLIESLNNNSAGFLKTIFIKLKEGYKIEIQNEKLALKYIEQSKKLKSLNFNNVNKFRKIGLSNIGATCYMNATLECFINVDPLTRYLLTESNYNTIINNARIYELSSVYCDLLASVCCDENIINYFKPYSFKEVISSKNPIFEGINANDSKDLINFMLEEMNQELSKINHNSETNEITNEFNVNQINQQDQLLTLTHFKNDFTKKNDSIISRTFFFIIESKSQCLNCMTMTYNYQSLSLLEFPLEAVYNSFKSKNYNLMNNDNKIVINLKHCFEHYRESILFSGDNQIYCNVCKRQTDNVNSNILYSMPPFLIIILNRGKNKSFDCIVDFPEILNLQNYVLSPQSIYKYRLNSVICHLGSSGMFGHFIAYCRQRIKNEWYCFNDSTITLCKDQKNDYRKGSPYILFYESIDKKPNFLFSDDISNNNGNFISNNNYNNSNNLNNSNINNINNYGNTWYMNNSNIMVNNANKYIGNNNWNNNFNNININLNYNMNNIIIYITMTYSLSRNIEDNFMFMLRNILKKE